MCRFPQRPEARKWFEWRIVSMLRMPPLWSAVESQEQGFTRMGDGGASGAGTNEANFCDDVKMSKLTESDQVTVDSGQSCGT